ncbi:MAG TPA: MFS transporter [Streptosporangiaceae bacterium]|nr:MFS transporter [Streptosporangiaceae bacterium]
MPPQDGDAASARSLGALPRRKRAVLILLALATLVGATGLAAGGTAGALLGARLAHGNAGAGLPLGVLVLGSAAAAVLISRLTVRIGRGRSLALGYLIGGGGAGLVILAAGRSSLTLLLIGSALAGAANAAVFLTRYAAAAVGGPGLRGRALGVVFLGTAIGAVLSSALLGPSEQIAAVLGLPGDTGLYVVAVLAFAVAAAVLAALSTAPPRRLGRHPALLGPTVDPPIRRGELRAGLLAAPARSALIALASVNFIMVAIMAVAPVHLTMEGATLRLTGIVIAIHVAGMFMPAPISGWLADRTGPATVAAASGVLLIAVAIAGALTGHEGTLVQTLVLALLGVGWNLGVVGASALLSASVSGALRPHAEGIGEVAMGVAAAAAAPLAGLITHVGGLAALWLVGAAVAGLNLAVLGRSRLPPGRSGAAGGTLGPWGRAVRLLPGTMPESKDASGCSASSGGARSGRRTAHAKIDPPRRHDGVGAARRDGHGDHARGSGVGRSRRRAASRRRVPAGAAEHGPVPRRRDDGRAR